MGMSTNPARGSQELETTPRAPTLSLDAINRAATSRRVGRKQDSRAGPASSRPAGTVHAEPRRQGGALCLGWCGLGPLDLGKAPPRMPGCSPARLPRPPRAAAPGIIAPNNTACVQWAPARPGSGRAGAGSGLHRQLRPCPSRVGLEVLLGQGLLGLSGTLSWPDVAPSGRMGAGGRPSSKLSREGAVTSR